MAYFANGTEGQHYQNRWCEKCVHFNRVYGCPMLSAHMDFPAEGIYRPSSVLHCVIPMKGVQPQKCAYWVDIKEVEDD